MTPHGQNKKGKYMRIASVKPNDLAVVNDGTLVFVSDALAEQRLLPKGASMIVSSRVMTRSSILWKA